MAASVSADNTSKQLDKNLVIYFTNDTVSTTMGQLYDEDEDEYYDALVPKKWFGQSCINPINMCGIPCSGMSTTDVGVTVKTRQTYADPVTGFTMKAGNYKGIFVDGTFQLNGALGSDNMQGFKNIKSAVLYLIPVPTTWKADGTVSLQDYPTGRIQAKYVDEEGTAVSNQGYREIHINEKGDEINDPTVAVIKGTDAAGFERDANNPLAITVDRPIRLEVNLQNRLDGKDYEDIFENPTTKQSEFKNLVVEAGNNDYDMSYYFADPATCDPYYDSTAPYTYASASGYDCLGGKWGTKVNWNKDRIVQIGVKKRLYLVGMALVSANETTESEFIQCAEGMEAKLLDSAIAYGSDLNDGEDPAQVIPGDANDDKAVSVADLASMASYILGEDVKINIKNADVNGDNVITVADLAAVANIILGGE